MKNLTNHLLIYDAECPVCDAYSRALVNRGLLKNNGRKAYQDEFNVNACPLIDRQRAANEIALVNLETGEVSYGAESILRLYADKYPALRKVIALRPLMWILNKLYAFISLNRRVILPPTKQLNSIQPALKIHYRIIYLVITWFITSAILIRYTVLLSDFIPMGNSWREYLICGSQIIFQSIIAGFVARQKTWDYLGNIMTISFAGALLLGLMLIAAPFIGHYPIIYLGYFMAVVGLMFLEHIRRTRLLQLGWWLTVSWAFYRFIVLIIILA